MTDLDRIKAGELPASILASRGEAISADAVGRMLHRAFGEDIERCRDKNIPTAIRYGYALWATGSQFAADAAMGRRTHSVERRKWRGIMDPHEIRRLTRQEGRRLAREIGAVSAAEVCPAWSAAESGSVPISEWTWSIVDHVIITGRLPTGQVNERRRGLALLLVDRIRRGGWND